MTVVKATCPVHGQIDLTVDQVSLVVWTRGQGSYYTFPCAECNAPVQKPADANVIQLLRGGGVIPRYVTPPLEMIEPKPNLGPLTWDVVLDLTVELAGLVGVPAELGDERPAPPQHR